MDDIAPANIPYQILPGSIKNQKGWTKNAAQISQYDYVRPYAIYQLNLM